MHNCIHDTLIPKMLELMSNGITKANLLEKYGTTNIFQETVGEFLIKIGFKYNYDVNNYYVYGHKKNDMIWCRYNFIGRYLLLERCMFRWIQMTYEESEHCKGHKRKKLFQA